MTDDHDFLAPDNGCPMIYRRNLRVVAKACIGCGLSLNACAANREIERAACCPHCGHE